VEIATIIFIIYFVVTGIIAIKEKLFPTPRDYESADYFETLGCEYMVSTLSHYCKHNKSNTAAILEAAKYAVKSNDFLVLKNENELDEEKTDEVVYAISSSLANRRLISYGGVFRKAHKALNLDSVNDGDLLHTDTHEKLGLVDFIDYVCIWKGRQGYEVEEVKGGVI